MFPEVRDVEVDHAVEDVEVALQVRETVDEDLQQRLVQQLREAAVGALFVAQHDQEVAHQVVHALAVRGRLVVFDRHVAQQPLEALGQRGAPRSRSLSCRGRTGARPS